MEWEVGGRFKRKGTHVYPWLIHVDVWQKPTQYCNVTILQLKINKSKKKKNHCEPLGTWEGFQGGKHSPVVLCELWI